MTPLPGLGSRSEILARRALGYALDPDLDLVKTAALLVDQADGDAALLRMARRHLARAPIGEVGEQATRALLIASRLVTAHGPAGSEAHSASSPNNGSG